MSVGVAVGAALAFFVQGGSATTRFDRDGIAFRVPSGWSLTLDRINAVRDPVTVFTASTFPLRAGSVSSGGICSVRLQRSWRADGGYVQLTEERDGASVARMLRRVPPRPRHFVLDAKGAGGLCTPPDSGELPFKSHGRAFYVFYGFGRRASRRIRAQASALLDGMQISQR
ncbi:MAG TPA: hypothetical protein VJ814_10640 [Gaiellaceae bacterium]|nr:hypothetical protein [Gaiellaceae bacterium]